MAWMQHKPKSAEMDYLCAKFQKWRKNMSVILTLSNEGINDDVRNVYSVLEEKGKTIFHVKANCCLGGEYIEFRSMKGIPNLYAVIDGQEVNLMDIDAVWYHKPHLPKNLRLMQPPEYRPFVSK